MRFAAHTRSACLCGINRSRPGAAQNPRKSCQNLRFGFRAFQAYQGHRGPQATILREFGPRSTLDHPARPRFHVLCASKVACLLQQSSAMLCNAESCTCSRSTREWHQSLESSCILLRKTTLSVVCISVAGSGLPRPAPACPGLPRPAPACLRQAPGPNIRPRGPNIRPRGPNIRPRALI